MAKTSNYTPIKGAFWRFARVAIAVIIAGIAQYYGESEWYLVIAPILVSADKYIRENL